MKQKLIDYADRMKNIDGGAISDIFKYENKPGIISFASGNPGTFALPVKLVTEVCEKLLIDKGSELLQYGHTEGYLPFRESLIKYLLSSFNLKAEINQVLVTTGSMQGFDLMLKALINPGDVILTQNPVFLGALQAINAYEAHVIPVDSDSNGIIPEHLEEMMQLHHPKLLYIIPTFQNPTGVTLSEARRKQVAELAARYRVMTAEDDPYQALRYQGDHLPSIKSFDQEGWVVLLGSFSKIISPGLRVGFMAGDSDFLRQCAVLKQSMDVHTPNLNQAIVDTFLRNMLLENHIACILPRYNNLMETMLEKLGEIDGVKSYTKPQGGLFIFAELQEDLKAVPLFKTTLQHGLSFVPGEYFYVDNGPKNTLRLNFSSTDQAGILKGMNILKQCIHEMQ